MCKTNPRMFSDNGLNVKNKYVSVFKTNKDMCKTRGVMFFR